jgi:hypothetical protein
MSTQKDRDADAVASTRDSARSQSNAGGCCLSQHVGYLHFIPIFQAAPPGTPLGAIEGHAAVRRSQKLLVPLLQARATGADGHVIGCVGGRAASAAPQPPAWGRPAPLSSVSGVNTCDCTHERLHRSQLFIDLFVHLIFVVSNGLHTVSQAWTQYTLMHATPCQKTDWMVRLGSLTSHAHILH